MQLSINGETRQLAEGTSVQALVGLLNLNPTQVAIERNGSIVPKSAYAEVALQAGDALEIVQFIGGG